VLTLAFTAPETWGPVLKDGVEKQELTVVPYELKLDYNYWTYRRNPWSSLFAELNLTLS
jgi:tRNA (guanine37-N1)-methyltransferase